MFAVFFSYLNVLHTSLARVQGFSLMVATHNSSALKANGMTEDIFIIISGPGEVMLICRQVSTDNECV